MIKASVIIPVHNAEKTLRKCVESLVFGKEREIELILVEDHSSDQSWELCCELEKEFPQLRCFQNNEGQGVSSTRNLGLAQAAGEYILFVDSDDWVSGEYVKALLAAAAQDPELFALCAYTFIDRVQSIRKVFSLKWNRDGERCPISFLLWEKVLLQQLWNKIFLRSVIEEAQIRFDEQLSMGEDFAFVLAYLKAADVHACTIIDSPLYYYIRHHQNSLMSKFGVSQTETEFHNLELLRDICRDADSEKQYAAAVDRAKKNTVYQICRNRAMCSAEKIAQIETILADGQARSYYRQQQRQMLREWLWSRKRMMVSTFSRLGNYFMRARRDRAARQAKAQLKASDFSVISQNCIGGVFYHDMGMQFLSPTVNLFFQEPDFVRFAGNLSHYLNLELQMEWGEEYPVGRLGDVRVFFMHYDSCTEAAAIWERRKERIRWDRILILATDMEGFDESCYEEWKKIPFPKVLFSVRNWPVEDCVSFPEYADRGCVPDLIPRREFYRGGVLMKAVNKAFAAFDASMIETNESN